MRETAMIATNDHKRRINKKDKGERNTTKVNTSCDMMKRYTDAVGTENMSWSKNETVAEKMPKLSGARMKKKKPCE